MTSRPGWLHRTFALWERILKRSFDIKLVVAFLVVLFLIALSSRSVQAEGIVAPKPRYCSANGLFGGSPDAVFQAEEEAVGTLACDGGNTEALYYVPYRTIYQAGGQSEGQCKVPGGNGTNYVTVPGDVVIVEIWHTACGAKYPPAPTGSYWTAYPIDNVCPEGSALGVDSQCHCNWSYADNGQGCTPYGITRSSAPPADACHVPKVGDPIYPLTGAIKESIDLQLGMDLAGRLDYNTSAAMALDPSAPTNSERGHDAATMPWDVVGDYWFTIFDKRLVYSPGPTADPLNVLIYNGSGEYIAFTKGSQGAFTSTDRQSALVAVSEGYRYYDYRRNAVELYSAGGQLQSILSANGQSLNIVYSTASTSSSVAPGPGYAIALVDSFGRTLNTGYRTLGTGKVRLATMVGPTEGVSLDYYPNDALKSVTWIQAGTSRVFNYDTTTAWALQSVQDESNVAWLRYGVDANGRATSQSFGNGAGAYSVTYFDAAGASTSPKATVSDTNNPAAGRFDRTFVWAVPTTVQVHLPNGEVSTWSPTVADNYPAPGSSSQPAGAGCAASASSNSYDSVGDITSHDDFNGNRRCTAYDTSRGLPTTVLEGRANNQACSFIPSTADVTHPERLTTTAWHPDWALKTREAEPKKVTTWVYNGQPDPIAGGTAACVTPATVLPDGKPLAVLCARYEQATTDTTGVQGFSAPVTGAKRAWTYTYNQYGQVLTETTPKLSPADTLSRTTTYVYYSDTSMNANVGHTMGDLQSVTNPLGQVTSFMSYDGAGRLLSSTDANGVVTMRTYWPRGWLKSQTVTPPGSAAPQLTSYDYWPTGLLKTVTMADASTLNYVYDDAHRLTDVSDSVGNKVHYVLDNSGNRTSEQVSDATGNLVSTVTRVFDALNRVQSQTGLAH
jgi:YD repeat-containing protein